MDQLPSLASRVGSRAACEALNLPRATLYRRLTDPTPSKQSRSYKPPLALSDVARQCVLKLLHSERYMDMAPRAIFADLLDQGIYHYSVRTMYRLLEKEGEVRERRNQRRHPLYQKPELLATAPNQLWSWDITKLKGPVKWNHFYLYVIINVFSRYVVGWMLADREKAALANQLIRSSCHHQKIQPGRLTIHADRGSSMTSKPVAFLLADLGITKTHSRPQTSNDNPFSGAQFKTLKYRPDFPQRFGSILDARSFCRTFFSGITTNVFTPELPCSIPLTFILAVPNRSCSADILLISLLLTPIPPGSRAIYPYPPFFSVKSGSIRLLTPAIRALLPNLEFFVPYFH